MCKICKSETTSFSVGKVLYHKCLNCGFTYKDDSVVLSEADEYNRYLNHDNDTSDSYKKYQEDFYDLIKDFLGETNLDFGCGNYHILANVLNENGYKTNYFDLYFYSDTNYEKDLYEAIILEEVIEHLKDPVTTIAHLVSLLNDDGNLIIRTRLIPDSDFSKWWYIRDTTHISFFTLKTFLILCDIFSLKLIYSNEIDLMVLKKG